MTELLSTLSQFGPGVATVAIILFFKEKDSKRNEKEREVFVQAIKDITKEHSQALQKHTKETIIELHKHDKKIDEMKNITKSLYEKNVELVKEIKEKHKSKQRIN